MLAAVLHPAILLAALLTLLPLSIAALFPHLLERAPHLPGYLRILCPAVLSVPYILVATAAHRFHWSWLALYLLLPPTIALLLASAGKRDPGQRGTWQDFLVLIVLGLAVDLRWFEAAWPRQLVIFSKMLLLDAGIYGFLVIRKLDRVGFDLRIRWRDLLYGLRELSLYAPVAIALGLTLGFLHFHDRLPTPGHAAAAWIFTFFFIAVPEELFFRGWLQNLLERRVGRQAALLLSALLFGLSHFNKRATHFNWRYVLLAMLAGIFYGRAWRQQHRVAASAITHASVDTLWSLWFR